MNIEIKGCKIASNTSFEIAKNSKGGMAIIVKNTDVGMSQEQKQDSLSKISQKLSSGKKLTGGEMKMLQQNSPVLFQKAVFIEMERKQIKKQLNACKSKKEVRDLYDRKMMQFLAEQKAIDRTSMPKEKKEEAMEFLKMRREAFADEFKEFKESDKYKSLPEKRKEEKDSFDSTFRNKKDAEKEIYFQVNEKTEKHSETDDAQIYFEQTKVNISV
jgi:hypothetical protein